MTRTVLNMIGKERPSPKAFISIGDSFCWRRQISSLCCSKEWHSNQHGIPVFAVDDTDPPESLRESTKDALNQFEAEGRDDTR